MDELRALLAAKVVRGISVGFKPIESKPRSNGGTHYLKQVLVEASLVAVPANPSALLTAKALGISEATQRLIFKQSENLTIAQRIRKVRRAIQNAKLQQERAKTPAVRAAMAHAIRIFEREKRELLASLPPQPSAAPRPSAEDRRRAHALEVRARAIATLKRVDDRIAAEYAASPAGQSKRHTQETIEAFTRANQRLPQDQPKPTYERYTPTWRGVKLPGLTWRGKKI